MSTDKTEQSFVQLHLRQAWRIPAEIDVERIAWMASEAAFGVIAEELASNGYPVTGDFAPDEVTQLDHAFGAFVYAMALNNPDMARLQTEDEPMTEPATDYRQQALDATADLLDEVGIAGTPYDDEILRQLLALAWLTGSRAGSADTLALMTKQLDDMVEIEKPPPLATGVRVRLRHPVDRYPHFLAAAGLTGVITQWSGDFVAVTMDEPLPGAQEWGNEIHWIPENGVDPARDLEVIR